MSQTKICRLCGQEKKLDQFGIDNSTTDGLNHWCRECVRTRAQQNRAGDTTPFENMNRLNVLVDALIVKERAGYIDIPGTLKRFVRAFDLNPEILVTILKEYLKKAGRSRYRVVNTLNTLKIREAYLDGLIRMKHVDQTSIEFEGLRRITVNQLVWSEYNFRLERTKALVQESLNIIPNERTV